MIDRLLSYLHGVYGMLFLPPKTGEVFFMPSQAEVIEIQEELKANSRPSLLGVDVKHWFLGITSLALIMMIGHGSLLNDNVPWVPAHYHLSTAGTILMVLTWLTCFLEPFAFSGRIIEPIRFAGILVGVLLILAYTGSYVDLLRLKSPDLHVPSIEACLCALLLLITKGKFSDTPILFTTRGYVILTVSFLSGMTWTVGYFSDTMPNATFHMFLFGVLILLLWMRIGFLFLPWSRGNWYVDVLIGFCYYSMLSWYSHMVDQASVSLEVFMLVLLCVFLVLMKKVVWFRQDYVDVYYLLDKTHEAEEASKKRNSLIAGSLAHDLRSPIINAKELLEEADRLQAAGLMSKEDSHKLIIENLNRVEHLAKRFTEYVNASTTPNIPQEFNIKPFLEKIASRYITRADITVEPQCSKMIFCDPEGLERAIENIIENSITHNISNERPKINISRCCADDGEYRIFIEDDGPGVDPELREEILKPFSKTGSSKNGSGLGLAIAIEQLRRSGGDLRFIDPFLGDGARVSVSIPCKDKPSPHETLFTTRRRNQRTTERTQ